MQVVGEALTQIQEGRDFDSLGDVLTDLSPEQATSVPSGCPYSIATIVFHMWFWHDRWLKQIEDIHCESFSGDDSDFKAVSAAEWESTRQSFFDGYSRLREIAGNTTIYGKPTQFGDTVEVLLLRCALHSAYHIGQIVLLRRLL